MFETQNALPSQSRWFAAVRGIVAILFGIIALVWPGISLFVLVYLFGAYVLVNGVFALIGAFQMRSVTSAWWAILIEGLLGIVIGLMTFFWPGMTVLVLLMLIATWAVILGIFEIVAAFASHVSAGERWMSGIAGALSIVFGILLFTRPGPGLLTVIWLIGFYAIVWGILLIAYSLQRHETTAFPQMQH